MAGDSVIYLDHNATTPCAPEVIEAMIPFFGRHFGNPSSPHHMGRTAARAVDRARQQVASLCGCLASEIFFTSGATESNNIALLGASASKTSKRRRIVTTAVEHSSVLGPCDHLTALGLEVVMLPVDRQGVVDLGAAEAAIDDQTLIVSVQGANNETGVVQPIERIVTMARQRGALVHSDSAQILGKLPLDVTTIDLASFSAHKLYGPKGAGALFVNRAIGDGFLSPVFFGGGQEGSLRPGTLNTAAIVGFGEACELASTVMSAEAPRLAALRANFEAILTSSVERIVVNSGSASRLPGTSSVTFRGVLADLLIAHMPLICFGHGSACSSGTPSPSHVLVAMGIPVEDAECTLRFSFGRFNGDDAAREAASRLTECVHQIRSVENGA